MATKKPIALESTGNAALDDILGGGIPARSVVIIGGEPGSGKTVVTLQMVFRAAQRGKRTLYFTTLAEPAVKVMRYMQHFDFFDPDVMNKQLVLSDLGKFVRDGARAVLAELEARVAKEEPDFVVVDSFKAIAELLGREADARAMIYDLAVQMAGWGATTLLVGEYTREHMGTQPEFGIVDGIVRLGSERQAFTSVREIEVLKLRGAAHKGGTHFFDIDATGAAFFPRVGAPPSVDDGSEDVDERASSGVAGLDELLHGGVPRGGTTLVQGGTGTGKTLLGLRFLIEGARRGERGVIFTSRRRRASFAASRADWGGTLPRWNTRVSSSFVTPRRSSSPPTATCMRHATTSAPCVRRERSSTA